MATSSLTIRLSDDLRERMTLLISKSTYKPSITAIVERGIVLALAEIERMEQAREQ